MDQFCRLGWLLIGYCAVSSVDHFIHAAEIRNTYGPFAVRVGLWPLVILAVELMLWFKPFRHRESGARVMSAFMGIALLGNPVLVSLLIENLYEKEVHPVTLVFFVYVALSHLLFSIFARR